MTPLMYLDKNGHPIQSLGIGTSQVIDGTAASAQSTVFDATNSTVVRVAALGNIWLKVDVNPTAVTEQGAYFPLGRVEDINVPLGYKIAVIGAKANLVVRY